AAIAHQPKRPPCLLSNLPFAVFQSCNQRLDDAAVSLESESPCGVFSDARFIISQGGYQRLDCSRVFYNTQRPRCIRSRFRVPSAQSVYQRLDCRLAYHGKRLCSFLTGRSFCDYVVLSHPLVSLSAIEHHVNRRVVAEQLNELRNCGDCSLA